MYFLRFVFTGAAVAVVVVATGCGTEADDGLENGELDATSSLFSMGLGADGCNASIPSLSDDFLAAMTDCGGGLGKCVPPSPMMPASAAKELASCEGGASCVPLAFLRLQKEPLKQCTSYGKVPGVCVSRVVPKVDKLTFLPQDACKPEERCAPCVNPSDGKATGICEMGKPSTKPADQCKTDPVAMKCPHEGKPVLDVNKLPSCASKGMHCLPKAVVPAAFASMLAPCKEPDMLCAPDRSIEANGQFIPKTCASVGGAEGRCLHQEIPQVAEQAKFLPRDACEAYERCIPCFDPLTGEELPSCRIACDPGPTKPKMVFGPCAEGKGRCVPKSAVSADQAKQLKDTDCKKDEELCAPVSAIARDAKVDTCELKMLGIKRPGDAVCVEDVLKIGFALSQSNCKDGFKCTPCNNPLDGGTPTGLRGCPK